MFIVVGFIQLFKKVTIPEGGVLPRLVLSMKKGNMIPMAGTPAAAAAAAAGGASTSKASTSWAPANKKKTTKAAAKMIKAALDAAKSAPTTPAKKGRGKSVGYLGISISQS